MQSAEPIDRRSHQPANLVELRHIGLDEQRVATDVGGQRSTRIAVPTLVVEGAADKLLPDGWAAEIAAQIPGGRSAVVERAGHCPQIEHPDAVNELLLEFLGDVGRERTAS